jgi:hypothetical protein
MTRTNSILLAAFLTVSMNAAVALAQISVTLPDTATAPAGQMVTIPVQLDNPGNLPVDAFGMKLTFPTSLASYVSVEKSGTLTDSWFVVDASENVPGELTIGGFHTTPVTTSGILFEIRLQMQSNVIGESGMTLSDFIDDIAGGSAGGGLLLATVAPGTGGLLGSYYDNNDFTALYMQRVDPIINFNWASTAPDPGMGVDDYSIRWTGQVVPDFSETYTFYTVTDDGVRLWVDNQLIIDQWIPQSATEWSGNIALTAGQAVDITMEFYERGGDAVARLLWESPSVAKNAITGDNLLAAACGQGTGDLNGDVLVTSSDAACAFETYLAGGTLPGPCNFTGYVCELLAADVNCDASITPNDAREIELRGLSALPPAGCFAPAATPPPAYDLAISQALTGAGQLRVTIAASNPQGLDAFGLEFSFPDTDVSFDRIEAAWATAGWFQLDAAPAGAGVVRVGGYDTVPVASTSPAEVFHLYFDFLVAPGTVPGLALGAMVDDLSNANVVGLVTDVRHPVSGAGYRLHQNYPNPFNPVTTIRFEIPAAQHVTVAVYSVRGELVRTLLDGRRNGGAREVSWDGRDQRGAPVHSGVYFYTIRAGGFTESRRMVLLK